VTDKCAAQELQGVGVSEQIEDAMVAAEDGNMKDARKIVDSLLIDEGMDGEEILRLLVERTQYRYPQELTVKLVEEAASVDLELLNGASERVHLTNYLTEIQHAR